MQLELISSCLFTPVRRLCTAYGLARTRQGHGFLWTFLAEYRRGAAATRRYEQLSSERDARAEAGIRRAEIARQVFEEHYASENQRDRIAR